MPDRAPRVREGAPLARSRRYPRRRRRLLPMRRKGRNKYPAGLGCRYLWRLRPAPNLSRGACKPKLQCSGPRSCRPIHWLFRKRFGATIAICVSSSKRCTSVPYARNCRRRWAAESPGGARPHHGCAAGDGIIRDLDGQMEIEVGLLIFPSLSSKPDPLSGSSAGCAPATPPPDHAGGLLHRRLPSRSCRCRSKNPDVAVRFMRRSPDPTIQLVRPSAIERACHGARDPESLSRHIAEAGLRAVTAAGTGASRRAAQQHARSGFARPADAGAPDR